MFAAVVLPYHLRIHVVRAEAGHFNHSFPAFVRNVLRPSVNVDYSLRRRGKRFLADLFIIRQRRDLMSPRPNSERHFAWMKRRFGWGTSAFKATWPSPGSGFGSTSLH